VTRRLFEACALEAPLLHVGAFDEFLVEHPEWGAVQYQPYATFCNSFILHRR
jgi:hypothetical protein